MRGVGFGFGHGITASSGPSTGGVQSLFAQRRLGGQLARVIDDMTDAFSCDLMKRARNFAMPTGDNDQYAEATTLVFVQSLTRSGNVVSVVLNSAPQFTILTGHRLVLTCLPDPTFDVDQATITVTNQTHFTYPCAGADGVADIGGDIDVPAAVITSVAVGNAGHPKADFLAVLSTIHGSATSNADLNGTYLGVFPAAPCASLTVQGGGGVITNYTNGGTTFTLTLSGTQTEFTALKFTGVPTDGSFRLPRIIRTDHPQSGNAFLRPDFKVFSSRFSVMRMMDAGRTNNNCWRKTWAKRNLVADGTGLSLEEMIAVCNELGADLWYCMPAMAANDYIDGAATLIRDTLDPALKFYCEPDNESFNSGLFRQWHWHFARLRKDTNAYTNGIDGINEIVSMVRTGGVVTVTLARTPRYTNGQHIAVSMNSDGACDTTNATITNVNAGAKTFTFNQAGADHTTTVTLGAIYGNLASNIFNDGHFNPYELIPRMYSRRCYEIGQRVKTVFGGTLNGRARMVLMWQMVNYAPYGDVRDIMLPWLQSNFGTVSDWLYGIGGAPYAKCLHADANATEALASMTASMNTITANIHDCQYLCHKYSLKHLQYEGGPDMWDAATTAIVDSVFNSAGYRTLNKYILDHCYGYGVDVHCIYNTGMAWPGWQGDTTWGVGRSLTADGGPIGSATAQRLRGIDDALLLAPSPIIDTSVVPGAVVFQQGATVKADEFTGTVVTNGMRQFYSPSHRCEKLVWAAAAGNVVATIWGKVEIGGGGNGARVYVNDALIGSLNLFTNGTPIDQGTAGGSASPGTISLPVVKGWNRIAVQPPTNMPDGFGVSKIVTV